MFSAFGLQISFLDVGLLSLLLMSFLVTLMAFRRIAQLEEKLQLVHVNMTRDIKMVNQGAIGIGRRFSTIEKSLKKSSKVAQFESVQDKKSDIATFASISKRVLAESKPEPKPRTTVKGTYGRSTKAEQALSAWISDHQTA